MGEAAHLGTLGQCAEMVGGIQDGSLRGIGKNFGDPCAEDAEGGKIWGDMGEGQECSHRSHSREAGGRQDVLT